MDKYVLWFDDQFAKRETKIKAISKALGLKPLSIEKSEADKDWLSAFARHIEDQKVDTKDVFLVVVDHFLVQSRKTASTFDKGASLCSTLRIHFADVPILGVSNARAEDISPNQLKEYTHFEDFASLPVDFEDDKDGRLVAIQSIVSGFSEMRKYKPLKKKSPSLLSLAKVPEFSQNDFLRVIPFEFQAQDLSARANEVFDWYMKILFEYQGVLIDICSASARIGVTEEFFKTCIQPKISGNCVYSGIFKNVKGIRFWRNELFTELQQMVNTDNLIEMSHYGEIFTDDKKNWAKCRSCGKYYTELEAYAERNIKDKHNKRVPAHRLCVETVQEPCPMFFEPKYILDKGL